MNLFLTILQGVPWTLLLTFSALGIGLLGGIPLLLGRRSRHTILNIAARSYIELFRGVPPIVWIFLVFFGIGNDYITITPLFAAIVTFGLVASAYMAEIYRGSLSAVHFGQWEAGAALGFRTRDQLSRIIGPQVLRISVPAAATYGIGLLKDSSIAFTIGFQGILFHADAQAKQNVDAIVPYLIAAGLYVVLTALSAWATRYLDSYLRARVLR